MNYQETMNCVKLAIDAGITPMVWGAPGTGKTAMSKELAVDLFGDPSAAEKQNLKDHYRILTGNTVTIDDLTGIPFNNNGDMQWSKPGWIPAAGSGSGLILIDEITDAPTSIQKGFYTIALEHRSKEHSIPSNWHIVMAGNRPEDKSGSKMLPSALITRCVHLGLYCDLPNFEPYLPEAAAVDIGQWLQWAVTADIDSMIIAWLKTFTLSENIYRYQLTPRTLEMVSKLIRAAGSDYLNKTLHACIIGTIGIVKAMELISFFNLFSQIPDIDTILHDPDTAAIPTDYGILNALCASLIYIGDINNADSILRYAKRLDKEPEIFLIELLRKKDVAVSGLPSFIQWRNSNQMYL